MNSLFCTVRYIRKQRKSPPSVPYLSALKLRSLDPLAVRVVTSILQEKKTMAQGVKGEQRKSKEQKPDKKPGKKNLREGRMNICYVWEPLHMPVRASTCTRTGVT